MRQGVYDGLLASAPTGLRLRHPPRTWRLAVAALVHAAHVHAAHYRHALAHHRAAATNLLVTRVHNAREV